MSISEDVQKLEPGNFLEFYELDSSSIGGGILYFQGFNQDPVIWQGTTYAPWPIYAEGFARTSNQQPTPKLRVANIDGSISFLCLAYDDLVGSVLTRRRTFLQYLDDANWPNVPLGAAGGSVFGSGWALSGVPGSEDTVVKTGASSGYARINLSVPLDPPNTYSIHLEVSDYSGDSTYVFVGGDPSPIGEITANGAYDFEYTPSVGSSPFLQFESAGGTPGDATISFFVVEQIVGNPSGSADSDQHMPDEVWFVGRKAEEMQEHVEFELASPLDFNNVQLPNRQIIADYCSFDYRGPYCNYSGDPVADALDNPTSDPDLDRCGKRLSSCQLREWPDDILNFGGFPAAGLIRV